MTLDEFRSHTTLPNEWRKELASNRILQIVLAVLDDNHPCHFTIRPDTSDDISPTKAAIELGVTRGYSKYGDTLKLLAKRVVKTQPLPEPTYEKPPPPDQP